MKRPKLPSELHPDYPKNTKAVPDERGILTYKMPTREEYAAFYAAHPEFDNEPEQAFRCEMCGNDIDSDHCYCDNCGDHAGSWVLVDPITGEEIE